MFYDLQLIPGAIYAILADVAETHTLTLSDRFGLMAAVMDEHLTEDECRAINRLLRAVQRGRVSLA
ncbi:hypothetical protein PN441_01870 [Spirulina major CS-329]|jgi:hypothetical protein|uniref:hypothetical protein n=1 Tax=Spirulina TaxID=1154 RepID=UPI00232EEE01|nr:MULTISPECIES: hypothetical protein [Spirulina]MDB9496005.1 hypothetical protein [Spirulina subsalsa CS-330]MDB9501802.1 hypothetical protein [Spirulina major CS-329]